ncbi:D-alanyl-D-alanine carboxypeptidase [Streptomyces sp. NPDC002309]
MEEASVAGESPDSSKQRESSAEPTPGSASPVPEARSGAAARDPRLAVAREPEGGSADTATRVLSVKERSEDAGERSEDATEGAAEETASEEPAGRQEADGGAGPGDSGDARLKAAVAAWVTSGSTAEPEARDEGADDADADAPAGKAEGDDATPEDSRADAEDENDGSQEARQEAQDTSQDTSQDSSQDAEDAADDAREDAQDDTAPPAEADTADAPELAPDDTEPAPDDAEGGSENDAEGGSENDAEKNPDAADDAPKADAPPVDQPTAVFRALKPQPAVDQPTTMLKLSDTRKPAPEPATEPAPEPAAKPAAEPAREPAREPAPEPESVSERTSRFVALKPLDDPSTRKPPPPAETTTAPPRVAPGEAKAPAERTAAVPQVGPERTTQQPLPPKPPLDLLAELTNTPPPPQTPLRTAVRRVKIWTPLALLLVVAFAIAQALRPLPTPTLELTAEESFSFEGKGVSLPWPGEGQGWMDVNGIGTMSDFGKQEPVAIGSVAKAMTAYVVLKKHPLKPGEEGPKIPVDALAEKEGGYNLDGESTLNTVKQGDELTLRQALSAIMIPSANNIARLLARWDSGTEAAFIEKMNDAARELGMENTTYTDASGLKETTVSTAEDQVKLGNELVQDPGLVEITSMGEWVDPSGQKWYNYNKLVPFDGGIGIKTGTTSAAGGNLLFAARKEVGGETVTVVGAILGQHKAPIIETVNEVSKTAVQAAREALTSAKILKKGDVVGYVDDGLGGRTPVVATQDVTAVGWAGHEVELSFTADDVPHSAKTGTKVGTLTVGDGSGGAVEVPVALQSDLAEPAFLERLTRVA